MATVIQAVWAFGTAPHAGRDNAVYGLTLSGRDTSMPGIADIVGPTMTTVPLRICPDHNKSAAQFRRDPNEQAKNVRRYQNAGLQRIRRFGDEARQFSVSFGHP